MTVRSFIKRATQQEDLNFLLTNRIPRRLLTRWLGWFSRIEQPLVRDVSIALWRLFSDLDLRDARDTRFASMHACFTRTLKDGARPVHPDPAVLTSPCDGIVGAAGRVRDGELFQLKGFPYSLSDLLHDPELVARHKNGTYVTLRLTSSMYHRFHAPHALAVEAVTYISGDTWNVNPIALARIENLFCKNERAVIRTRLAASGHEVTMVAVAAILVSGIRFTFLSVRLPEEAGRTIRCDAAFGKGAEMGWFEHGSTILVFAPDDFVLCETVREAEVIRMGQPLMRLS